MENKKHTLIIRPNDKALKNCEISIPKFTILTGENGSGKTQILEYLNDSVATIKSKGMELSYYISRGQLESVSFGNTRNSNLKSHILQEWNNYKSKLAERRNKEISLNDLKKEVEPINNYNHNFSNENKNRIDKLNRQIAELSLIINTEFNLVKENAEKINVKLDIDSFTIYEFFAYYPIYKLSQTENLFNTNFYNLCYLYLSKFQLNAEANYYNEKKDKSVIALTDDEFIKLYGENPLNSVNHFLDMTNLGYQIEIPEQNYYRDSYEFNLIKKQNQAEININSLSSGEKVMLSLVLAISSLKYNNKMPDLFLIDEPDATLHPTNIKLFIENLKKVVVDELGLSVIMTTHSPTTVALADEESIFVVSKEGDFIQKTTKDKALKILTTGLPYININYEKRRTVFVESDYDAKNYEKLFDIYKNEINSEISLTFISSGQSKLDSNGNRVESCEQVRKIVRELTKNGNKLIRGVIDYDNKNFGNENIVVLGNKGRYAIENYILDPILVSILLVLKKIRDRDFIELIGDVSCFEPKEFESKKLQLIINRICEEIYLKQSLEIDKGFSNNEKIKSTYLNGIEVEVPEWYFKMKGHKLEEMIKATFPELKEFKEKNQLLKIIIDEIIENCKKLIPLEFVDTFRLLCQ